MINIPFPAITRFLSGACDRIRLSYSACSRICLTGAPRIFALTLSASFLLAPAFAQPQGTTSALNSGQPTVRLVSSEWPPFSGERLPGGGSTTDLVRTVFTQAGFTTSVHYLPWARAVRQFETGTAEAIFPAYSSEDRRKRFILSAPLFSSPLILVCRTGEEPESVKLANLKNKKIGIVRGYVNTVTIDNDHNLQMESSNDDEGSLRKLLAGRIDLAVIDETVGKWLLKHRFPEQADKIRFLAPSLEYKTLHIMFAHTETGASLAAAFDSALAASRGTVP